MNSTTATLLSEYQPAPYRIPTIELIFELDPQRTVVTSKMQVERSAQGEDRQVDDTLVLCADELSLVSIAVDGQALLEDRYEVTKNHLKIKGLPAQCQVEITNTINPSENKELMGLYASSGNMCTQCEAEGFRRITYALDRPDVLSVFTTRIIADPDHYPTLLSNGNLIDQQTLPDGRHLAVWHDPFPKPPYLFALVAGRFDLLEGSFTTMSGREVSLHIYTDEGQADQCHHALEAVKKSMRWDEVRYGREYDLDLFMIVAVNDFNFGAMENKGLNIFNAKYILARDETATDMDFSGVDTVVAHEYFHNWSGNRVTLRDWFQLSLKEGLTVYRDQSFDEDNISKVVHRVNTVNRLRSRQFKEDQGPMAHPVQPKSYLKIDNFYTLTIYGKGAEVIRMFNLLLGDKAYRAACDQYFDRFDGQAVTIQDFAETMQEHTELDLSSFFLWYHQAGTPIVRLRGAYDPVAQTYTLTAHQHIPPTAGQDEAEPMMIPIKMGLIDEKGRDLKLPELYRQELFLLSEREQSITFHNISSEVVPSLFRHFSAPVRIEYEYSDGDLERLMSHDSDGFNRWQAGQDLSLRQIDHLIELAQRGADIETLRDAVSARYLEVMRAVITEEIPDRYYHAQLLSLPSESYIAGRMSTIDPEALVAARDALKWRIADTFYEALCQRFTELTQLGTPSYQVPEVGRRALAGTCLQILLSLREDPRRGAEILALAQDYFASSFGINMTDTIAALSALAAYGGAESEEPLAEFYQRFQHHPLVINKWLAVQATARRSDALNVVQGLLDHSSFSIENPNNIYATLLPFTATNTLAFHDPSGEAYRWIADQVLRIDQINPMVAARVIEPLTHWKRYDATRSALMRAELERILKGHGEHSISDNIKEYVLKSLS